MEVSRGKDRGWRKLTPLLNPSQLSSRAEGQGQWERFCRQIPVLFPFSYLWGQFTIEGLETEVVGRPKGSLTP